ncbi:hypothetical protein DBV05_g9962 [Lasiodiplodia theobromae]|uniref:Cyclin N-terminal domain-containing protein n=1 Tax=Lasiodiplodia theobromae TaxID=45133 RepID=A0A5N5D1S8_9PEZI|nr:hypothetical protein DBV05_g9962 [Lasiodiplodia theobromae]
MCFGKPDHSQSAAPANPMSQRPSVELPHQHHPAQDPPQNNPLCYHTGQMINFILSAGEPLFAPHLPAVPGARDRLWDFIHRIIDVIDPEIQSIFLGMAYYKAMMESNRMYYHEFGRPDSLLATAIMLAEKVVRDGPPCSPEWEYATGFRHHALDELERAWLREIGHEAMGRRWAEGMTAWRDCWEAYLEMQSY